MKEYVSEYKNYDDYAEFKPGYYLDALDQHKWKVAQIKDITRYGLRTSIEVHFDGYSNRYDSSYDLPSSHKLAPFRTQTLPYTGMQTLTPNRQDLQQTKFAPFIKQMNKISSEKNLQKLKAGNINQILRGQIFIMVDNIITKRNLSINFAQIDQFLQSYIKEGIKILINSGQYVREFEKEPLFDPSLFTVHAKIAIVLSNTEFLFVLNSLIGNKDQRAEIIKHYQRNFPSFNLVKKIKEDLLDSKVMNALDRIMKFKCINGKTIPWSLKKQICILNNFLVDSFSFEIPSDHREMLEILDYMSYFSQKGLLQKEQQEKKTLKVMVSLIINGNFQGRLRGLNEIKKLVQSILYKKKEYILVELTNSDLLSFLIDNKNFNQEIFKRSLPLFSFFYQNKLLNKKQLLVILNLHKDKHQLQLKGYFSTLAEFTYFLQADVIIAYFQDIIKSIPLSELLITFIKDYTLGALNKNSTFKAMYCKQGWELGLTYFWNLMTSEKVELPSELKQKIIQAFAVLMAEYYYSKQIEKYIGLAIKGIANRKNLEVYYKLIDQILKISKGPRISKYIQAVEKQISIVQCVIQGIKGIQISDKMWECMFQFLEEVTYVSKRKMTYAQIKQFWRIKACRTYLLKFFRKYRLSKSSSENKSQQKIINKQLPIQTLKEIIERLFLEPKEMQEYENIHQELYQTADELIIAFNHQAGNIDYNYKHTIRTKNPDKIYGLEFYTNIINRCKSKVIVERSIHRLIELFIRYPQGYKNTNSFKLANWKLLLQKLSKLKRYNLLSYNLLLEDLKGRMKSLNILEPDLVQFMVFNKANQEKKIIEVPRYTSLWKVRQVIGDKFDLPDLNFQIKMAGSSNKDTDFQKEEDFSTALISIIKDGPSIYIIPNKFRHPHLQALSEFYQYFSQTKGEELYDMLIRQQGRQALQLLNRIPTFRKIQQKLEKLSFKDPNEILDQNSLLRLSYQLKIIGSIKNIKHSCGLIDKSFIPYISKIFLNKNLHNNPENYVTLTSLINFLNQIIKFSKMVKNAQIFNDMFLCELLHMNATISPEYIGYLGRCFAFLKDLSANRQLLVAYKLQPAVIFENKQIDRIFQVLFLAKTDEKLAQIIVQFAKNTNSEANILRIAYNILNNSTILQRQHSCRILFDVVYLLIEKTTPKDLIQSLKRLHKIINRQKIMQQSQQTQNELLIGVMSLMIKCTENRVTIELLEEMIGNKIDAYFRFLIEECLFNFKEPNKIRFKSSRLRELGYQFINRFNGPIKNLTTNIYRAMKEGGSWRRHDQWNISLIKQNPHKFTGLKNLAATCYINSLLQQLFFIQNFRNELLAIDAQKIDDKENIVLEIQNIFAHLKYSESSIYQTSSLCKNFILDGQPIDPRIQTDVDQFFHSLMDKLQRNLNKISKKSLINNIFGGQLSNLIVGSKCEHTSQRIESFLSIRLQIKDKASLQQAFKEFIKGEALQGDNAYFCQRCDQKVKATKRVCLKTLPEILIITLKRFQFNYETMEKFKLNTLCSFAKLINVLQYTKEGIQNDHELDESNYEYKLKGVVIHYGISEAGHYTSYIQAQEEKWHYFDDEKITEFNVDELGNECFGGVQQNPFGDDQQKKKNAYLLFYEKVKKASPKVTLNLSQAPIVKEVQQQNTRNKLVNLLFEPNLYSYMMNMKEQDIKTLVIYFHLVFLRSAYKKEKLEQFYTTIQSIFRANKEVSAWYLAQINQNFLNQFIFLADLDVRYIITGLVIEAFKSNNVQSIGELFLEQFIFFTGKKNFYPAGKILKQALKIKIYEKFLLSFNIGDVLYQYVKNTNKEIKFPKELRTKKAENQLGFCNATFSERNLIDPIDFLQVIDSLKLNLTYEDLEQLCKRAKKSRTQQSLAIIFVKKFIDYDKFDKVQDYLAHQLDNVECTGPQDEYTYNLYISIIQEFALIKDPNSQKRIERLAKMYVKSLQYNLCGYRCPLMLLLGLFRICSANDKFRDRISEQFQEKEGKKLLKDIKLWIKDINTNLLYMIRNDKLGVWRKPKGSYQSLDAYTDEKINQGKILQSLNAVIQKHNSFLTSQEERFQKDEIVKFGRERSRHLKSYGLVSEILIKDQQHKIVLSDELIKLTYF